MQHPSKCFETHGANGHHEENWGNDGTDGKPWAFDRLNRTCHDETIDRPSPAHPGNGRGWVEK